VRWPAFQIMTAPGDLSSLSAPAFLLSGRSVLEMEVHYMSYPELFFDIGRSSDPAGKRRLSGAGNPAPEPPGIADANTRRPPAPCQALAACSRGRTDAAHRSVVAAVSVEQLWCAAGGQPLGAQAVQPHPGRAVLLHMVGRELGLEARQHGGRARFVAAPRQEAPGVRGVAQRVRLAWSGPWLRRRGQYPTIRR